MIYGKFISVSLQLNNCPPPPFFFVVLFIGVSLNDKESASITGTF